MGGYLQHLKFHRAQSQEAPQRQRTLPHRSARPQRSARRPTWRPAGRPPKPRKPVFLTFFWFFGQLGMPEASWGRQQPAHEVRARADGFLARSCLQQHNEACRCLKQHNVASADRPGTAKNHGFGHERAKKPSARALTSCAGCCRPQDASGMPNGPKNPKIRKKNGFSGFGGSGRGPPRGPARAPFRACAAVGQRPLQFTEICRYHLF